MAILKGAAAEQWLKDNPKAKYKDLSTGQVVGPERSKLANLLLALSAPIRKGAVFANPLAAAQLYNPERLFQKPSEVQAGADKFKSIFLTPEEEAQVYKNPLSQNVKTIAGVASYLVPAGAGIAGLAKSGAVAGALGGYGASQEGQGIESALKGAALGGVIGGGVGVAQSAIGKLLGIKNAPKVDYKAEKGLLEKITPESWYKKTGRTVSDKELEAIKNTWLKTREEAVGKKLASSIFDFQNDAPIVQETLEKRLTPLLQQEAAGSADDVVNLIGKRKVQVTNIANKMAQKGDTRLREAIDSLDSLVGTKPTNGDIKSILDTVDDILKRDSKGMVVTEGFNSDLDALNELRKALRKQIQGEANKNLDEISKAIAMGDEIRRTGSQRATIGVLGARFNLPKKVTEVAQKAVTGTRNIGRAAAELAPENLLSSLGSPTMSRGSNILSALGASQLGGGEPMGSAPQQEAQLPQLPPIGGRQLDPMEALSMASKMSPGASLTSQIALAKFFMEGQGTGTAVKKTDLQRKAETAFNSVNSLEQILSADPGVIWKQYLPFQAGDPEAQMFESASRDITDALARMRTGAVINAAEEKLYRKYIPKITDTPQNVAFKLQQLKSIFGTISQGSTVDTSGLTELLGM